MLAATAARAISGFAVTAVLCFSLGYTMLVFVRGVFGSGLGVKPPLRLRPTARKEAVSGVIFAGAAWL